MHLYPGRAHAFCNTAESHREDQQGCDGRVALSAGLDSAWPISLLAQHLGVDR